jgi:hypothetical protein
MRTLHDQPANDRFVFRRAARQAENFRKAQRSLARAQHWALVKHLFVLASNRLLVSLFVSQNHLIFKITIKGMFYSIASTSID